MLAIKRRDMKGFVEGAGDVLHGLPVRRERRARRKGSLPKLRTLTRANKCRVHEVRRTLALKQFSHKPFKQRGDKEVEHGKEKEEKKGDASGVL